MLEAPTWCRGLGVDNFLDLQFVFLLTPLKAECILRLYAKFILFVMNRLLIFLFVIIFIVSTILIGMYMLSVKFSQVNKGAFVIQQRVLSQTPWTQTMLAKYPFDQSSHSGIVISSFDDQVLVFGKLKEMSLSKVVVSTKYGDFDIDLNSDTSYSSSDARKGLRGYSIIGLGDFSIGDIVAVRCKENTRADIPLAVEVQKVISL